MKDRFAFVGLALSVAIGLVAVPLVAPSRAAEDITKTFPVSGFESVRMRGVFTTEITAGTAGTHLRVSGSSDVVDRVTATVDDGTLVIGMRSGTNFFEHTPKITISVPKLRGFTTEGTGSTRITGLNGSDFAIENSGTGNIVAAGRAGRETITLNGTGKIDTTAVDAHDVTVNNNGVGRIAVRASGALTMSVNGIGSIRYTGKPTSVESNVNGLGSISRM